jgi:predicted amidophosphoribosyltransferase
VPLALPPPQDWLAVASALLAPPACVACGSALARVHEPLCGACRAALPWLLGPRCPRCALPAPCGPRCPLADGSLASAWTPMAYEGPARELVHALKLRGALVLVELMAAQIVATAPAALLRPGAAAGAALVPVPAASLRRRARGFDQAARLAAAIADRTGLPTAACLRRVGPAPRQARARRAARLERGRIGVAVAGPVPPRAILVDDVLTTGATLQACAAALRAEGAGSVVGLAYARALR